MTHETQQHHESTPQSTGAADPAVATEAPVETVAEETHRLGEWYAERQEKRRSQPRVTIQVDGRVRTDPESWAAGADFLLVTTPELDEADDWNVPATSRPDVGIVARKMPWDFTFQLPDLRTAEGLTGDYLIRDNATGHVFALTARAFEMLFQRTESASGDNDSDDEG